MASVLRLSDIPEVLSAEAFWSTVGKLEHEQLDFKQQPAHLTEPYAAMAMTTGGLVVIGVGDDRTLRGCELTQRARDHVTRPAGLIGVDVQVKAIRVDGVPLALVAVPEVLGRIVTTSDGRLLRRVGSDCLPLVGDALGRFVREREQRSGEDEPLSTASPADFDVDLVNEALERDGRPPVTEHDVLRALTDLGVAEPRSAPADPQVLVAAAMTFATDPRKFVPGAAVQVVRRDGVGPGTGPTVDRVELTGSVSRVLDDTLDYIRTNTRSHQMVVGRRRIVLSEYPEDVLREALLNALAHRDFAIAGTTVDVTVWGDRVEIQSPGGLPGHITLENMRIEHYSRNRRVMRVLKLLGLVEEYGEGIDRMFEQMAARLMDPPLIEVLGTSVRVTLKNRFLISVEDQAWLAVLGHLQLSPTERRVLVAARSGPVTPRALRRLLPDVDVDQVLRGATARGLLVRVGERGGTRYELSDEVVMRAGSTGVEAQTRKRQMLLDEMRERGSISTPEGADLLHEGQAVVRHLLNDLVQAGAATARGQTRARRYYPA